MPATCKRCDDRERDFGGCRCQAFALTGDAAAVDPACPKSPAHALVRDAVAAAGQKPARGSYRRLRLID
jgi:pyrroloquinoline quinone biosynthesis protein E